jgi:acyl-CoA synthetase (AMP-forming)/AMP-acid ligase II
LNNCQASAVITQGRLQKTLTSALSNTPCVKFSIVADGKHISTTPNILSFENALLSGKNFIDNGTGSDLDLAMLIYTSGSTAAPKGVMMLHQNIEAAATSVISLLKSTADDIILSTLPLSHSYGLYQIFLAVMTGATLILEKSFRFPHLILEKMREEQVTCLPLVPTIAAIILQMKDLQPGTLPHLRTLTNAAAALPPSHIERLQELFPGTQLYSMYGQTECKRGTCMPPEELRHRPTSVGFAIPNTKAYVVDEKGHQLPLGETGELVIQGPHVMQGYWNNKQATAQVLRPGPRAGETVLHTGDLFRTDQQGYLYFMGRKDDIIKTLGEKVNPLEIENILYALPGIREAMIVGIPDEILGSKLKAIVVTKTRAGLTSRQIITHCTRHLEDFMVPKEIEFRDKLPKTENGKICRRLIENEQMELVS